MLGEHASIVMIGAPIMALSIFMHEKWGFYFVLMLYLNKDFLKGQSPLKRLLNTQVQDNGGARANEWQCFLRNTTLLIWPLEVMILAINGRKRLGDYIANTQVVDASKNACSWRQELAAYRVTPNTFYTLIGTGLYILLVHIFFNWLGL